MKKLLLTLLIAIVILGAAAGIGFAGYRLGYAQGAAANGTVLTNPYNMPHFHRDFGRWQHPYSMPMMGRDIFGFSLFTPLRLLWNIAILALIVWFVSWLFTQSGWRITRQTNDKPDSSPTKTDAE